MIRLSEQQYAAIGKVAVQSGSLDRELGEYLLRLGVPRYKPSLPLGTKVATLQQHLASVTGGTPPYTDFDRALSKVTSLIEQRNAAAHGTWSDTSNVPTSLGQVVVSHKSVTMHARDIAAIADKLCVARKLLLCLFHDHYPVAAGHKSRPNKSVSKLLQQL